VDNNKNCHMNKKWFKIEWELEKFGENKNFFSHAPQWSLLRGGLTQKHPPEHSIPPVSIFPEKIARS
jgi:hypothetical protein